tara:strand:+ start:262 stop:612 length:351 start_codon:yes stop_codon:yes gene_type:complete
MISYSIATFISLNVGLGCTKTPNNFTLGSKFLIEFFISSRITAADASSTFSNSDSDILDPKFGRKNFSPGYVNTIFLKDRAIALEFFKATTSSFKGFAPNDMLMSLNSCFTRSIGI